MINILVLLPYDELSKERLVCAVKDKCNISFINRKEQPEEYLSALKTANLIIGEVPNGDFQLCVFYNFNNFPIIIIFFNCPKRDYIPTT